MEERDEVEKEKVLSEEIRHDGISLIGGQGLAGKEAQPAEKTEARDLPQEYEAGIRFLSAEKKYQVTI